MGNIDEFSRSLRVFLRTYRWRRIDPVPWQPLAKPLSECRVGIVTSAGLVEPGQEPFDDDVRGGDWSYRVLSADADVQSLIESHRSNAFDRAGLQVDKGLAFPLERLRELVANGRIGSISGRHLSFMGSITAPGRLIKRSAPEAAKVLVEEEVDVALLVPV
jgi:D-proline reductase (dithiol) PrdB